MLMPQPSTPPSAAEQQALDWFVRQGAGLSAAEEQDLQAWLAADPAHRAAFTHWQRDWAAMDALPAAGVDQLRRQIAAEKSLAARCTPSSPARRAWWRQLTALAPQAALAAAALTVCSGAYLAWDHQQQQTVYRQHFATARGQQLDVQLPDGSRLRLDTATRMEVTLYRQRREVRLDQGQAQFQVQGDTARPFDVLAGPVRITVVGTRFSVRHTPEVPGADGVRVAVEHGRVRVTAAETRELTDGQHIVANAQGQMGPVARVDEAGIAPWRDGRIAFDNTPLDQALAEFARYGETGLIVRDPAVGRLRLTGTFDPRRLDNFLRTLPKVLPVVLLANGDRTEIAARR